MLIQLLSRTANRAQSILANWWQEPSRVQSLGGVPDTPLTVRVVIDDDTAEQLARVLARAQELAAEARSERAMENLKTFVADLPAYGGD